MDASGGQAWQLSAACRDWPLDANDPFFANFEGCDPPPEAVRVCDGDISQGVAPCPVRTECLDYATSLGLWGVWGGTSHWQRQQLKRRYRRMMCPRCRVVGGILLEMGDSQACLTCAVAWRATPARQASP